MEKQLKIENVQSMRGKEYNEWMIYTTHESNDYFEFLLKNSDGSENHASVRLYKNIRQTRIRVKLMYRHFKNVIWDENVSLIVIKDKLNFWNIIANRIEIAHIKYNS